MKEGTFLLLRAIYELALEKGIEADPRGPEEVRRLLARQQQEYEELKESEKQEFDLEKLRNPYSDTRILHGTGDEEVRGILAGIDIEVGEVLLADRLREKGYSIDLLLAHHPEGRALSALHEVMHLQEDVLHQLGIPINVAEGILVGRIGEVHRRLLPLNHNRTVDVARLLGIPFMCVHTPADNLVTRFLEKLFAEKAPATVGDVIKVLKELPEYREAVKVNAGPRVLVGTEKKRAGKIFVDMTGGTSGAKEAYEKLAVAGVGTVVCMHLSEDHRKEAEKHHINVIVAGHIASDSLGMNLFLDELERRGVQVFTCSGLIRVARHQPS